MARIAFIHPSYCNCQLEIFQLIQANIDGIFQAVSQQKESCSVLCIMLVSLLFAKGGLLTKSTFPKEGICILHGDSSPFRVLKVVREEFEGCRLFTIPARHAPKALKHCFFLESKVVQTTICGILHITLCIFVSCYSFELGPLEDMSIRIKRAKCSLELTKAEISDIHMKIPLSRAFSHNIRP